MLVSLRWLSREVWLVDEASMGLVGSRGRRLTFDEVLDFLEGLPPSVWRSVQTEVDTLVANTRRSGILGSSIRGGRLDGTFDHGAMQAHHPLRPPATSDPSRLVLLHALRAAEVFAWEGAAEAPKGRVAAPVPEADGAKADEDKVEWRPWSPAEAEAPPPTHWVGMTVVDDAGAPVANVRYVVVAPDGRKFEGAVGSDGTVRLEQLKTAGLCKLSFPDLDGKDWKAA